MRKYLWQKYSIIGITLALFAQLGCSADSITSPSGSTITITPSAVTLAIVNNTPANFSVFVVDENGHPMNKVELTISGGFAVPRTGAHYQFYNAFGGLNGVGSAVDSGFTAETDVNGVYQFSVELFVGTYTDTIHVFSGSGSVSATLTIT